MSLSTFTRTHREGHTIEERRPSATRVELMGRLVEGRIACAAGVHALVLGVLELAATGRFGALLAKDTELLLGEDRAPLVVGLLDGLGVGHGVRIRRGRNRSREECEREAKSGGGGGQLRVVDDTDTEYRKRKHSQS